MSFELINQTTKITREFSKQFWAKALELAELYGWRPMGTCSPSHLDLEKLNAEWDGGYMTNDGQIVKAVDALLLAFALEKALDGIPNKNSQTHWDPKHWMENELPEWLSPEEREFAEEELHEGLLDIMGIHPLEYFAGDENLHLMHFIKFCRCGRFEIL